MADKTVAILIGIQGSGKSEFYRRYLAADYIRVNHDSLKTRRNEQRLIEQCIADSVSYAVDNTNPTRAERGRYIKQARENGYSVIGFFIQSRLQECIARNDKRIGAERIPAKAIAATSNKLELPSLKEGFDELYFVANDGAEMTTSTWREEDEI